MGKMIIGFASFATASAANKTFAKVIGASARTFEVVEIGCYGAGAVAPADIQHNVNCGFLSNATAGTAGASPVPEPMSKASPVSANTAGTAFSAEPTTYVTVVAQLFSFNQRGGFRWAVPVNEGFRPDPVANFSFGARVQSSGVGSVDGTLQWWE
jgi:hypothetical protein